MDEGLTALVKPTDVSTTQIMLWRRSVARWDGGMTSDPTHLQSTDFHTSIVHSS